MRKTRVATKQAIEAVNSIADKECIVEVGHSENFVSGCFPCCKVACKNKQISITSGTAILRLDISDVAVVTINYNDEQQVDLFAIDLDNGATIGVAIDSKTSRHPLKEINKR